MKKFLAIAILLSGLALAACHAVYVTRPVGDKVVELKPEDWEGVWTIPSSDKDETFTLYADHATSGGLIAVFLKRENDEIKMQQIKVTLRACDASSWFITVASTEETDPAKKLTFLGLLKMNDGRGVVWPVDTDAFAAAVASGKLPGKVDDNNSFLGALRPKDLDLITTTTSGLLDWRQPGFMRRIAGAEGL